jgi:excisionase family DNA binding protein
MSTQNEADRAPLTIDQAAQALGLSRSTVKRRIGDGTIRVAKVGTSVRVPAAEVDRLLAPLERNGGEYWMHVTDAAARLGIDDARIRRRAPKHLETRHLGEHLCVRQADVERWAEDGLPHPHMEALADGSVIAIPNEWATADRPNSPHGRTAFVALKPLNLAKRKLQVGDILAADESPTDGMVIRHEVAELPMDRGVLGLVVVLQARVERLENERLPEVVPAMALVSHADRHVRPASRPGQGGVRGSSGAAESSGP